jgi:hypothetical protein
MSDEQRIEEEADVEGHSHRKDSHRKDMNQEPREDAEDDFEAHSHRKDSHRKD